MLYTNLKKTRTHYNESSFTDCLFCQDDLMNEVVQATGQDMDRKTFTTRSGVSAMFHILTWSL